MAGARSARPWPRWLVPIVLFVALAAAAPGASPEAMGQDAAVPILMYHAIGSPPTNAPYPELYVSARDFRAHVDWLAEHGYHAVTLRRVYDHWIRGASLPAKPVVLSFDDGYPGHVDVALPALSARRWPGVLNFHIGNLTPARVRALVRGGWEINSHTFSHLDLTTLDTRSLRREIAGSRTWIRGVFHVRVDFFCYPSGRYDDTVVRAGILLQPERGELRARHPSPDRTTARSLPLRLSRPSLRREGSDPALPLQRSVIHAHPVTVPSLDDQADLPFSSHSSHSLARNLR